MFSLSLARQFLVCVGNRQTFKDLSHQIIQTTSLEQDLPQQKSTDNNSQWFPLFPCQVAGLCAFSCRRRLSGMYTWPSCIGTAVRECYDVKEAEKCEEVLSPLPACGIPDLGCFWNMSQCFFFPFSLIRISFLLLSVSVIPLSQFWSDILFIVVFRADMCSSRPALLVSKSWIICPDGSFQSLRQWNSVPTKQYKMTPYIFSKHIAGEIRGLNNKWESKMPVK